MSTWHFKIKVGKSLLVSQIVSSNFVFQFWSTTLCSLRESSESELSMFLPLASAISCLCSKMNWALVPTGIQAWTCSPKILLSTLSKPSSVLVLSGTHWLAWACLSLVFFYLLLSPSFSLFIFLIFCSTFSNRKAEDTKWQNMSRSSGTVAVSALKRDR